MLRLLNVFVLFVAVFFYSQCQNPNIIMDEHKSEKIIKTDEEWKSILTPEQYEITRKKGTERAFTGIYLDNKENGIYKCVCCGAELFDSSKKFKSGSGWPSFFDVIDSNKITKVIDRSFGMTRIEITCAQCNAHLGHLFDDGPPPTQLRYCVNSASLKFENK